MIYTHENFATGTRAIRIGTQKDGIFIDFYSDGTWGYTGPFLVSGFVGA